MMAARLEQETALGSHGHVFTVGDIVTVQGSPGVWRIAYFFGGRRRPLFNGRAPLIADLVRVDKKWTAATSAYVSSLRAVA